MNIRKHNSNINDAIDRYDSIDLLRFVAATAVVFAHIPNIGIGSFGVDIFFAISGFVMLLSTEKYHDSFLIKRFIRIAPMYYIFTIFVFFIALNYPNLLKNTKADYIQLLKSLLFIPFSKGDSGHRPILFLGWTLNYEMFFYTIFYIALKFNNKYRSVLCSFILSAVYLLTQGAETLPLKAYAENIVFEFVLGMTIYELVVKSNYKNAAFMLALTFTTLFIAEDYTGRLFQFGLPSAMFMFTVTYILKNKELSWHVRLIGGYSYALYLTHPYIIQFFDKVTKWFSSGYFYQLSAVIISIVLANFTALFIYKFIENPTTKFLRTLFVQARNPSEKPSN